MARTFYDMLMLAPEADADVITVVYRHLAKRYHPDANPGRDSEARMMELNEAYATLGDRAKRARYDDDLGRSAEPVPVASEGAASDSDAGAPDPHGAAGPPPLNPAPAGSELTFGRYRGWTLNQVARYDRDYLEWLARSTMGRNYAHELAGLLRRQG